jgi:hypothetical protein
VGVGVGVGVGVDACVQSCGGAEAGPREVDADGGSRGG